MKARIQLLLLDDHTLFRAMLSRLLGTDPDFRVVAHCSTMSEALDALERERVDLVLLDYDLGKRETGFEVLGARATQGVSSLSRRE